jgi:formamidopyrimidine-DNA glycosylase
VPELPEVETVRRELAAEVEGRTIVAVRIHKSDIVLPPNSPTLFRRRVRGRRVESLARRGKYLLLHLDGDDVIQVQLRMSGRFALGLRQRPAPAEFGHIAVELDLDDGRTVFYDDVRRLGGFRVLSEAEWRAESRRLGPEPLSPGFRTVDLEAALSSSKGPVKNALMDQRRIAGVGNIYASEALHAARIDPRRAGRSLDRGELRRLHRSLRRVLRGAIRDAGTTFRSYRTVNGRSGSFQEKLRVYGREGRHCPRCGGTVERLVQAGRSTFHCPGCQR